MTIRLRISVALNLMLVFMLIRSDGILHLIREKLNISFTKQSLLTIKSIEPSRHIIRRDAFDALPARTGQTVFLGDSLIENEEWNELFNQSDILNRGISGDTIVGVQDRVPEIAALKPRKIFLMCGINSLLAGLPPATAAGQYRDLVQSLLKACPDSTIYIQSVLPTSFDKDKVAALNHSLQDIKNPRVVYIDIYSHLLDKNHSINSELCSDGIHPNGAGYGVWGSVLRPYL